MKKIIVVLHFANTKRFHVLWPRILSNGYGGDIVNRCAMGQVIMTMQEPIYMVTCQSLGCLG